MSDNRNILDFIRSICANGESGRLEILAGAIQGELSFAEGKLVDARFGHLTGFRAVNAVAAMRDARFSFDPTFAPLASSSITASERVVLKQFFGIDTAATNEYLDPVGVDWPQEAAPVVTIPDVAEEVTLVRNHVPSAESPSPVEAPRPLPPVIPTPVPVVSRFSHRSAIAFAVLAIAVLTAAAVLVYRVRESRSPAVVASAESPARPAPVQQQPEAVVAHSTSATPAAVKAAPVKAAPVKEDPRPGNNTAQDLSGKWNVINVVETTSYNSFRNMKIGFDLSINQTGTTFTGRGRKVSENGHSLPASSRTPIQVKGTIDGDRIEATFFEEGTARKSNGRFVWRINKAGRGLTGSFATSAARSSGKSAATREL
jgi:hypothetical protein